MQAGHREQSSQLSHQNMTRPHREIINCQLAPALVEPPIITNITYLTNSLVGAGPACSEAKKEPHIQRAYLLQLLVQEVLLPEIPFRLQLLDGPLDQVPVVDVDAVCDHPQAGLDPGDADQWPWSAASVQALHSTYGKVGRGCLGVNPPIYTDGSVCHFHVS